MNDINKFNYLVKEYHDNFFITSKAYIRKKKALKFIINFNLILFIIVSLFFLLLLYLYYNPMLTPHSSFFDFIIDFKSQFNLLLPLFYYLNIILFSFLYMTLYISQFSKLLEEQMSRKNILNGLSNMKFKKIIKSFLLINVASEKELKYKNELEKKIKIAYKELSTKNKIFFIENKDKIAYNTVYLYFLKKYIFLDLSLNKKEKKDIDKMDYFSKIFFKLNQASVDSNLVMIAIQEKEKEDELNLLKEKIIEIKNS